MIDPSSLSHLQSFALDLASKRYSSSLKLVELERSLNLLLLDLQSLESDIESDLAFDPSLKNDSQRRARRLHLFSSDPYLSLSSSIAGLKLQVKLLVAEQNFFLDQIKILISQPTD